MTTICIIRVTLFFRNGVHLQCPRGYDRLSGREVPMSRETTRVVVLVNDVRVCKETGIIDTYDLYVFIKGRRNGYNVDTILLSSKSYWLFSGRTQQRFGGLS